MHPVDMYRGLAAVVIVVLCCGVAPEHKTRRVVPRTEPSQKKLTLGVAFHFDRESRQWLVGEIEDGMPAQRAGLRRGDVLLELAGVDLRPESSDERILGRDPPYLRRLTRALQLVKDSDENATIAAEVRRGESTLQVEIVLTPPVTEDEGSRKTYELIWDRVGPRETRWPSR